MGPDAGQQAAGHPVSRIAAEATGGRLEQIVRQLGSGMESTSRFTGSVSKKGPAPARIVGSVLDDDGTLP
ncbi:MAG: hypothetical protein ACOC5E_00645 [Acidobacteriota bacterium]